MMASKLIRQVAPEISKLGCVTNSQPDESLRVPAVCMAVLIEEKTKWAALAGQDLASRADICGGGTSMNLVPNFRTSGTTRSAESSRKFQGRRRFRLALNQNFGMLRLVKACALRTAGWNLGVRKASLTSGLALCRDRLSMEQHWQNYFNAPTERWDNRRDQLHPSSPSLLEKSSKGILWIDRCNTPEWVKEALANGSASKKAGARRKGLYSECVADPGLFQQDEFSWTASILRKIKSGQGRQALKIFKEMQECEVKPSSYTFVAALKACSSLKDLESAKRIHAEVVKSGFESVVYVGNVLVDVYSKCGRLVDARIVFDKMPQRSVVSWNAMILGYAQMDKGEEALQLYARMQQEGVVPDDRTFVSVLKACSSLAAVEEGNEAPVPVVNTPFLERVRAIHAEVVTSGFESDVFVGTMLVDVYAKCRSLVDARRVFEKMPCRNVVSWNAMILGYAQLGQGDEAIHLYARMQQEGVVPDDRTFVGALKACTSLGALEKKTEAEKIVLLKQCLDQARAIHSDIVNRSSESDVFVGTMLVDVYAKCGGLMDARRVFGQMPHRNVVSWTAMILGYAQMDEGEEALKLFEQMKLEGVIPNNRTYVAALKACSSLAAMAEGDRGDGNWVNKQCLEQVRAIHSQVVESGYEADVFVGNILVDAYAKCGSLVDARHIFDKMPHRTGVSWTAIILGYAQMEDGDVALELYARMQEEGFVPNDRTLVGALKACGIVVALQKGREIHAQISKLGLEATDLFVATALIDMYGKCGSMAEAHDVFDALPSRDVVPWTALIAGYAHQGDSEVVFNLFERMRQEGIQPDSITFLSILTVCSHVGLLDKGQKYFEAMSTDCGISPSIEHYNCMIDLLGRSGHVDKAMNLLKVMPFRPHGKMWRCLLGACQKWHKVELGRQAFEGAVSLDKNDGAAYILMSNIYAAAEMLEDAREIQAMRLKTRAWKLPGQSWWTEMSGFVHAFVAEDQAHPDIQGIYGKLQSVFIKMRKEGYVPHFDFVMQDVSCVEKEHLLYAQSKRLANAFSLMKAAEGPSTPYTDNPEDPLQAHKNAL